MHRRWSRRAGREAPAAPIATTPSIASCDGVKALQCIRCKHQTSLTVGTVFESAKLGLSTWYLAMYLLTQSKNGISAMDLKRQLGVSCNSPWMIRHKLMPAAKTASRCAASWNSMTPIWAGRPAGASAGAARKTPFLAAAQVSADGRPERLRLSRVNTLLGDVKRAIDGTYHACSSRYAGRYLAEFGYRSNRRYQLVDLLPRLAYVAALSAPLMAGLPGCRDHN